MTIPTMASPMPVLPDVGSMIVLPGVRIEAFEFGEYFHVRIGAQPVDPHHRGRADGPQNILFNHKSPLIKPRKDNHFPEKRLIL